MSAQRVTVILARFPCDTYLVQKPHAPPARFQLHVTWVPDHTDVAGSELADMHTKLAAEDDETEHGITALKRTLPRSAAVVKPSYKYPVTVQRTSWWATSPAAKLARIDNAHMRRLYSGTRRIRAMGPGDFCVHAPL